MLQFAKFNKFDATSENCHKEYINFNKQYNNKQHNIVCLVGNGFDVALLNRFDSGIPKMRTTYQHFYNFIEKGKTVANKNVSINEDNIIFACMKEKKEISEKSNWADFEAIVDELVFDNVVKTKYQKSLKLGEIQYLEKIETSLDELRAWFSVFLNELLPAEKLVEIDEKVKKERLAYQSLAAFLCDLNENDLKNINFVQTLKVYDLYNYLFFDFCYTMLLDNYIYLDRSQFLPHPHNNSDTNFEFYKNRTGENPLYSYVLTETIHPHGYQDVPRSILFGTDKKEGRYERTNRKGGAGGDIRKPGQEAFIKSYWAQNEKKYTRYMEDAELFIIYGMSISKTDGWWIDKIYNRLKNEEAELIIYYYPKYKENPEEDTVNNKVVDKNYVKELFLKSYYEYNDEAVDETVDEEIDETVDEEIDETVDEKVKERIFVVLLNEKNDSYFLGMETHRPPDGARFWGFVREENAPE